MVLKELWIREKSESADDYRADLHQKGSRVDHETTERKRNKRSLGLGIVAGWIGRVWELFREKKTHKNAAAQVQLR